jgi:hypothetical protein
MKLVVSIAFGIILSLSINTPIHADEVDAQHHHDCHKKGCGWHWEGSSCVKCPDNHSWNHKTKQCGAPACS